MITFLKKHLSPIPFFALTLYIFFMYNAQNTLFPSSVHSMVMYFMILVTFAYYLKNRLFNISEFSSWYFGFFILSIMSFCLFEENSDSKMLYTILVSFIILLCFIYNINTYIKLKTTINIYILSSIILAIYIWLSGQLDYLYYDSLSEERLGTEISGNANIFSAMFMYAGTFAAWFMIFNRTKYNRILYLISFLFIIIIMAISGGRKTIVAVIGALIVFILCKSNNKRKLIRNAIIACLIIYTIFYATLNIPILYDLIGQRFEGLLSLGQGNESEVSGDDTRVRIFKLAFLGWLENPIFGHGIDSFKYYNQKMTGHFYYAHNNYVELLYNLGIIGFIYFYWIYWYLYKKLKSLPIQLHKYQILGYGLLIELLIFDVGGVSYYLVGNIMILTLAYKCYTLKDSTSYNVRNNLNQPI